VEKSIYGDGGEDTTKLLILREGIIEKRRGNYTFKRTEEALWWQDCVENLRMQNDMKFNCKVLWSYFELALDERYIKFFAHGSGHKVILS
jgi:hypothetical protein